MALRLRRGTNAERQTITPLSGELIYVTDYATAGVSPLWVGDGTTVGGNPVDTDTDTDTLLDLATKSLGDLGDVNIGSDSTTPSDDEVLRYDALSGEWKPRQIELNTLADVSIASDSTALDHGDVLKYSDELEAWRPGTLGLENLSNVNGNNWENDDILQYNAGTGIWRAVPLPPSVGGGGGASRIEDLENVSIGDDSTLPGNNYILKYDLLSGDWRAAEFTQTLSTLEDVEVTTPSEKDILIFDSTVGLFKNGTFRLRIEDLDNVSIGDDSTIPGNDYILKYDLASGDWRAAEFIQNLNALSDVEVTTPSENDILVFDPVDGVFKNGAFQVSVDNSPTLGGNLDLNGFNITGTGNIQHSGFIQTDIIYANEVNGTFNGDFDTLDADLVGSVFAQDSVVLVDATDGTIRGKHIGQIDTSEDVFFSGTVNFFNGGTGADIAFNNTIINFNGATISGLTADVTGSVFADDSTVLVDAVSGTIPADNIRGDLPAGTNVYGDVYGNVYQSDGITPLVDVATNTVNADFIGNLNGIVTGEFVGDATGNFVGNLDGDVNGTLTGNIIGLDSTVIYDNLTQTFFGNIGNPITTDVTGDLTGSVFTDGSVKVIDGLSGRVFVDDISTTGLEIDTAGEILVLRDNGTPTLNFTNDQPTVDLSGAALHYLSIVRVNDQAGNRISSIIGVNGNGLTLAKATTGGSVPDANKIFIGNDGKFGMGTLTPSATLDVQGAIMPGVYADTTARDAAIPTPVAGMMVYLTSTNKHQGYNGSTWNDFY